MTAYTDSLGFNKGTAGYDANGLASVSKIAVQLDLAKIIAARSAAGATALIATDSLQVINIPAGSVVLSAGFTVTSVDTGAGAGTGTITLGDGSVTYASTIAINALGASAANLANPTIYKNADTLDVTFGTAMATNLVVTAWAIVADVS